MITFSTTFVERKKEKNPCGTFSVDLTFSTWPFSVKFRIINIKELNCIESFEISYISSSLVRVLRLSKRSPWNLLCSSNPNFQVKLRSWAVINQFRPDLMTHEKLQMNFCLKTNLAFFYREIFPQPLFNINYILHFFQRIPSFIPRFQTLIKFEWNRQIRTEVSVREKVKLADRRQFQLCW